MRSSGENLLFAALAIVFVFAMSGCGGGGNPSAFSASPTSQSSGSSSGGSTGSVTVTPGTASVTAGNSEQFTVTVTGVSNAAINWFVNGVENGNSAVGVITPSGLYTAPSCKPPASVTVMAQSVADSSLSASVNVAITGSSSASCTGHVTISPATATVAAGAAQQFTAQVTGVSNIAVNWLVNGIENGNSNIGTITSSGLYQAPSCNTPKSVTVEAQSVASSSAAATASLAITASTSVVCTGHVPHSSHVLLLIEENHSFTNVYPNGMPWLVGEGNKYGFASNYFADVPGSALDYFWLSSGSGETSFGCGGWGCPKPITDDNIFRELNNAGLSWKVYADAIPSVGFMGDASPYLKRHNPAPWYSDIINSSAQQQNMVPFTEFARDLAANRLPNYSIVVPDANHDAHDGTIAQADSWLKANIAPLLSDPTFQTDGLLIVTFDECDAAIGACPEQVYTAVIGPNVKPGWNSGVMYKHENTLRTILDSLDITVYPGASKTSAPMLDFFK